MSAEQVLTRLQLWENFGFQWIAAGTGGFHQWVTAEAKVPPRPEFMTCGLCCFHLPLAAAIESGAIDRERAGDLVYDQMKAGISGGIPLQWAPYGLTRHRSTVMPNHPNRGDVVYFSGGPVNYFAHVAVATGNGDEVITFGHDAPYLQGGSHTLVVERKTIAQIKSLNTALTRVHFGAPSW